MGGPLSVTLSDIHMIRTENNVVKTEKLLFYRHFVDTIIKRKKNDNVIIFDNLNIIKKKKKKKKVNHQRESLSVS